MRNSVLKAGISIVIFLYILFYFNVPRPIFLEECPQNIGDDYVAVNEYEKYRIEISDDSQQKEIEENNTDISSILPDDIVYREVNKEKLREWLKNRESILAEETEGVNYIDAIINAGKLYSVNPLLLIAITGQEQSFVPVCLSKAEIISGNPFNVHGSWEIYNYGINDSAKLAADTIVRLSKDKPEGKHPIQWLNCPDNKNGMYALDPSWWIGVSRFFIRLKYEVGYVSMGGQ